MKENNTDLIEMSGLGGGCGGGGCRPKKISVGGKLEDEGNELAKREEDTEETPWAKAVSAVWEVGAVLKEPAATEAHGTRKEKHRSQNSQMRGGASEGLHMGPCAPGAGLRLGEPELC